MASSKRRLIIENFKTAIAAISTANGYATDPQAFPDHYVDWDSGPIGYPLPTIACFPGETVWQYLDSCRNVRGTLTMFVEYVFAAPDQSTIWDTSEAIFDDVLAAVSVDTSRAGYALDTRVRQDESESGNADTMDSRGGIAAGIIRFDIDFFRNTGIST